jgi:pilus assembly protein CpaB
MRPKSIILLVLALGCGLVAAIGINQVIAGRGKPEAATGETQAILVAIADVNTNDPLTAAVVKLEQWPKDKIPPGSLLRLEDGEGRRAKTKLYAGAPILEAQLLAKGESASAGENIPPGYRVVAIRVDDQKSSGNLILPGDRVDVLVHLEKNTGRGVFETTTRTFLQDVKVFAVNDVIDRGDRGEERIAARTVSLLVKPDQAELLTLATEMGNIRLVMRGPEDEETTPLDGAAIEGLTGTPGVGDRAAENPIVEPTVESAPVPTNPFAALLGQPAPASVAAVVAEAASAFKMTVIRGPQVEEVELDAASKIARPLAEEPTDEPAGESPAFDAPETDGEGDESSEETETEAEVPTE